MRAVVKRAVFRLPVERIRVGGLLDAVRPPGGDDWARLVDLGMLGTVLASALIASAESLFSAAAVDRMHQGRRTDYHKELIAQGADNTVCGALGVIPVAALAGVLVYAGFKLVPLRVLAPLWRGHRGKAVVLGVTAVATGLFEGVLVGLLLDALDALPADRKVELELSGAGAERSWS
ncbi:hypothetical protein GTX53_27395 [Streptomyces sp. SID5594]|uniref:SulP family inorganic anion transporter n=1 Tax=Streptomyces sp. ScaeMP-e10 TaxID=1156841 RepID=UPI00036A61EE|nr:hypothetical protein [Streptomyces sp. SID5594]